jgi:tetratricopeptide (TPR) repeat protein
VLLPESQLPTTVEAYLDVRSPGSGDWRQKWRVDLQVSRAFILVCTAGTKERRAGTDWLYDEIDWWVRHRKTCPILVCPTGSGEECVPARIRAKWPFAQRIEWNEQLGAVVLARIRDGVLLSERGVNSEELKRLRRRSVALGTLAMLAAGLALGIWRSNRAEAAALALAHQRLEAAQVTAFNILGLVDQAIGDEPALTPMLAEFRRRAGMLVEDLRDQGEMAGFARAFDELAKGNVAATQGDTTSATAHFQRVIELARQVPTSLDGKYVLAQGLARLGDMHLEQGRARASTPCFEEAYRLLSAMSDDASTSADRTHAKALMLRKLSVVHRLEGRDAEAIRLLEEARGLLDAPHPTGKGAAELVGILIDLAALVENTRGSVSALPLVERAADVTGQAFPRAETYQQKLLWGTATEALGGVLWRLGRFDDARPRIGAAIRIARELYASSRGSPRALFELIDTLEKAARLEISVGRYREARKHLEPARDYARLLMEQDPANIEHARVCVKVLRLLVDAQGRTSSGETAETQRELDRLRALVAPTS